MTHTNRLYAAVGVLIAALLGVMFCYRVQSVELANARVDAQVTSATLIRACRKLHDARVYAEQNERAASRLRAVEAGVIIPVGTRQAVERLRVQGQLAP